MKIRLAPAVEFVPVLLVEKVAACSTLSPPGKELGGRVARTLGEMIQQDVEVVFVSNEVLL